MFDVSTFLSEPVQRIVLLEQELNSPIDNNLPAKETFKSFKNKVVKLNLETADDFFNGLKLLLPHAKSEYAEFVNDTKMHVCNFTCYSQLFKWLNMHSTTFEKGLFCVDITPNTDEWNEQILLAILKLTSCIEQALRDICYCKGVKCPMLMKDILKMPLLVKLFGEFHMKILQIFMGGPLGLNIRNLSWHGFLSPKEVPKNFFFLLLRTSNEMASHFLECSMETSNPKSQSMSSGHLLALQYFEDIELPTQSDFLAHLQSSKFVSMMMIPHFQFVMKLYQAKMFGDCLVMLLPLFEHILRCLFAHCNNCPNRVVTAESSEFYLTLDTILLQNFENTKENKVIQYLGVGYVEFLYDFFSIQDGIRIRDHVSHGQRDANTYPSNIVEVLLLATLFAAKPNTAAEKHRLKESLKTQVEEIQQAFDNYYSYFHQFSIVQLLCKTWVEKMEMIIESEILKQSEYQKVRNGIEDELNLNRICNRNETNKQLSTKLRTLFQGNKESLLLSTILKQICQSCVKTVDNFVTFLEVRNLQIKEKKLRSRQRTNFMKFIEILPRLLTMQFSLLTISINFVFVEFKKKDFVNNKRKEWKNLLKICENLVSLTSMSKNKWDEALLLVKQGMDIMQMFK